MYDSHVNDMLWYFREQEDASKKRISEEKVDFPLFHRGQLKKYSCFQKVIEGFRCYYGLNDFSLREIDIYLWSSGKEYKKK